MALKAPAPTAEGLRSFTQDLNAALQALAFPKAPTRLVAYVSAPAASRTLPKAAEYPRCAVWVSDLSRVAVSDGTNWIRQDTGATI